MNATDLQHVGDAWQQILRDALPDENRVRVGAVGFDGDFVKATVSLRSARIAIGFAVLAEDAMDATAVAFAFDQAVQAAGYAGNVKVVIDTSQFVEADDVPPGIDADGNIPPVGDIIDQTAHASEEAMTLLVDESPAVIDTADAGEEKPRRRSKGQ